jgi:hypothetical protein
MNNPENSNAEAEPTLDSLEIAARFGDAVAEANPDKDFVSGNTNSVDFQISLIAEADDMVRKMVRVNQNISDDELMEAVKGLEKYRLLTGEGEDKYIITIPDESLKEFVHYTRKLV